MKEKVTLFIALSFLVGLTAYKKSFSSNINLASNTSIEADDNIQKETIINENNVNNNDEIENYSNCESNNINTDELTFSDAFKYYRSCNNNTFFHGISLIAIPSLIFNQVITS